jgi:hypothetical protein
MRPLFKFKVNKVNYDKADITLLSSNVPPAFTYRITHRGSGGHHGEGSDAQQQRKEEAEAGQKQVERLRSAGQTRHLVHEPIRQEAVAGDHRTHYQRELAPGVHDFIRVGPIPPCNVRGGQNDGEYSRDLRSTKWGLHSSNSEPPMSALGQKQTL